MQIAFVLCARVLRCVFLRFLPAPKYNEGERDLVFGAGSTEKPQMQTCSADAESSVSLRCGGQGGGTSDFHAGNQSSCTFMSLY